MCVPHACENSQLISVDLHKQKRIKGAFDPLCQFLLEWALEDESKLATNIQRMFEHMDIDG